MMESTWGDVKKRARTIKIQPGKDVRSAGPCTVPVLSREPPRTGHIGNPPKGTDVRFIRPMVVESFFGGTSAEKRSFVSSDVARIALAIVRTTCGSTSVENADEKSVGIGMTSCGAGIRLSGGIPYNTSPPMKPAPITQIDDRSGNER